MYCPQCATPNADGAKFCRSCGQELEALAVVLSGGPPRPTAEGGDGRADWMVKRTQGLKDIVGGAILMLVSLLIGCALALFAPAEVPWMLLWVVFFAWLAVWGGIELANGIGGLIEAKGRLRLLELAGSDPASDPAARRLPTAAAPPPREAPVLMPATSVTEGTTRSLDDMVEK